MKSTIKKVLVIIIAAELLMFAPFAGAASDSRHYIVGVSPNLDKTDRESTLKEVLLLILDGAQGGDIVTVYDALNLQPVVVVAVPEGARYQKNPRARAQRLQSEIAILQKFFTSETRHPLALTAVIHLPQFLDLASSQLRHPRQVITVILVGLPFYVDIKDPVFNMTDGYVPSDEHLRLSARRSVYGTLERKNHLQGVTVHCAFLRECFDHDEHRIAVKRLWLLYLKCQQGVLATFAPAPSLAFSRARQNIGEPVMEADLDQNDRKLEMRKVVHKQATNAAEMPARDQATVGPVPPALHPPLRPVESDSAPAPAAQGQAQSNVQHRPGMRRVIQQQTTERATNENRVPAVAQDLSDQVGSSLLAGLTRDLTQMPVTPADKIGIGVSWWGYGPGANWVDVDLYVKAPGCHELSYMIKSTGCGEYFRDIRSASTHENDGAWRESWEYIELAGNTDLRRTTAWLNLYRGGGIQVTGVVRMSIAGRITTKPFSLRTPDGNGGAAAETRAESPFWTEIKLNEFLGP
jgi:hypothetical protein